MNENAPPSLQADYNLRPQPLSPTGRCIWNVPSLTWDWPVTTGPFYLRGLPLTYQGTGQCCRTWFASRDPHRGCLQTGGACRYACGPESPGHRCWSRGSRGTTHPRHRALQEEQEAQRRISPPGQRPPCAQPHPTQEAPPDSGPAPSAQCGPGSHTPGPAHLDTQQSYCRVVVRAKARCTGCCRTTTRRNGCGSASLRRTYWSTRSTGTTPPPLGHLPAKPTASVAANACLCGCSHILGGPHPPPPGGMRAGQQGACSGLTTSVCHCAISGPKRLVQLWRLSLLLGTSKHDLARRVQPSDPPSSSSSDAFNYPLLTCLRGREPKLL